MPLEWNISTATVNYAEAVETMESRVADIIAGNAPEMVWLLEHPPLYTAGTSAKDSDLLDHSRFPVYHTGRGGQFTYHGPGQRVVYLMLDLKRLHKSKPDIHRYVQQLEAWLIATLAQFGITGFAREGRVGVWVQDSEKPYSLNPEPRIPTPEKKIAALGIRVRKWVTYHGVALNVHPDLSHYAGIIPCGIAGYGVTSLEALGVEASMAAVDKALQETFASAFAV